MSMNLLSLIKDQVSGPLAEQAAGFLGEDKGAVQGALGSIFPSLLGGLLDKGGDAGAMGKVLDLVKGTDAGMLDNISGLFGGGASSVNGLLNSGGGIVDMILGDKMGGIVELISKTSGLKSGSAGSLLKMAAPFLMGIIGKKMTGGGVSGLMDLLAGQKEHVAAAMPKGMGDLLGFAGLTDFAKSGIDAAGNAGKAAVGAAGDAGKAAMGAATGAGKAAAGAVGNAANAAGNMGKAAAGTATQAASTGLAWIKWALPLIILAAVAYYFVGGGCAGDAKDAMGAAVEKTKDAAGSVADATKNAAGAVADATTDAAGAVADATADAAGAVGDMATAAFAKVDNAAKAALDKITFTAGSAGSQMMEFIDGGFKGDGKFQFSNLTFASGSAAISGESGAEVDNLAAILKAYPGVKVAIQGHTDNTGQEAANMELSQARADAVKARLSAQGIDAARVMTKGFGQSAPVADNSTPEGRKQNRRIEVVLVK